MAVTPSIVAPDQIVAEALEWDGTRFRHQGRMKGVTVDCAGLIVGVGHNVGALDVDPGDPAIVAEFGDYDVNPNPEKMMRALRMMLVPIRLEQAGPGDVVHLRFDPSERRATPQHLCIITQGTWRVGGEMIHAVAWPSRRVRKHVIDSSWFYRSHRAYRYPAVQRAIDQGVF